MNENRVRVLIVDDSATMRQLLTRILSSDPDIEVVGTASDPYIARDKINALKPDVLTLDVEMPRMDGLTFLEKLMKARPMPVVMVSSHTSSQCDITVRALEIGAVDFFAKPTMNAAGGMEAQASAIVDKVKSAGNARVRKTSSAAPSPTKGTFAPKGVSSPPVSESGRVIAIGASTGGPEALREVLTSLPAATPPIVIVQHMPAGFTLSFANRLNQLSQISVKEAADGDELKPGLALLAPGGRHMTVARRGGRLVVQLNDSAEVNRHRPSVDVLFDSCVDVLGAKTIGAILTGMGADGANGLVRLRQAGARTLAQDEASCVVFGMPREAILRGGAESVVPLDQVADSLMTLASGRSLPQSRAA